jgi:IS30 family transposase
MEASRKYEQLSQEDRTLIAWMRQECKGVREIAKAVSRSPSTISRELRRNHCAKRGYAARSAHTLSQARRLQARPAPKLASGTWLRFMTLTLLSWQWSPEQASRALKQMHQDDTRKRVSHETIYQALYAHPGGELRRALSACLRQHRSRRRTLVERSEEKRGKLSQMLSIHMRDPAVNERVVPGHWEADLIKGARNASSVGVLVERTTRFVMLVKLADATAAAVLEGFAAKFATIPEELRLSMTYDQGKEMARHAELSARTKMPIYFCNPHSPWQRGTCENTNGLLRQYLPKKTDLSQHSQEDLDYIAAGLNGRPRLTLGDNCPLYALEALLKHPAQVGATPS